ncbi:MAG: Rieske 2Fe-2S domain-containing protein [Alphaproteobacteria bacterium]|nr:Rieske 2Fe-2S domain-containing protein [Alphaproteobacteria bacterium]
MALMPKPTGVPRQLVAQISGAEVGRTKFPIYDSAPLGFPEYWYPVMWSRDLSPRQGIGLTLLGRDIAFFRDGGRAYAMENRCPHRGVQLHPAACDFPGTRTCSYHGWVFDLKTGALKAALTDGPDSPVVGKGNVSVRTYPVEERRGLVWIYLGDETPPPVETDIPDEFLMSDAILTGRITTRAGDWRHGCENGYDEGHVKYLHRRGAWTFWRRAPAWGWSEPRMSEDGKWLTRDLADIGFGAEYPGLGHWPPKHWWRWRRGARGIRFRLPGNLRVQYANWAHYEWYVPTKQGYHRYLQFICKRATGLGALWHRIKYYLYIRPFFHRQFNDQDAWMVENMTTPPEILYRPDRAMQSLRQYVDDHARGIKRDAPPPERFVRKKAQNEVIS